ncbi:MAG: aminoacyl-tRNA hydrolase [Firmicutes bacterium]|nr:aminoacyl-tRNA hydrolase [Bacillota bacterium]MDY5586243.1 aminoacyl-tRNA hydrolase [Eubacteriales bacterium]
MLKPCAVKEKTPKKKIKLIVGLGNPDKKYFDTYHNIGFCFIDKLSSKLDIKVKKKECKSLTGEGFIEREEQQIDPKTGKIQTKITKEKIILAKPQTYMNLSGEAVLELVKKYKFSLDEILIVLDDIDIEAGTYRYRENGSGGTHNGLRNIVQLLKSQEFKRIRIGIGKDERMDLADYVLSKISKENKEKINEAMERAIEYLKTLIY